jgi:hypothetical protein
MQNVHESHQTPLLDGQFKDSIPDYVRNVPALVQTVTRFLILINKSAEIDGYRSNSRREKERLRAIEREQSIVYNFNHD